MEKALTRNIMQAGCRDPERNVAPVPCDPAVPGSALALGGWTPVPTHRDFSPDHIVIDGDRITVLDLDEFCQYDPLLDVAHFVTHLRFLGLVSYGNLSRFDHLAARFLRS